MFLKRKFICLNDSSFMGLFKVICFLPLRRKFLCESQRNFYQPEQGGKNSRYNPDKDCYAENGSNAFALGGQSGHGVTSELCGTIDGVLNVVKVYVQISGCCH